MWTLLDSASEEDEGATVLVAQGHWGGHTGSFRLRGIGEMIPYFCSEGELWSCLVWDLGTGYLLKLLVESRVLPEVASWLLMVTVGDLSGKVGKITDSK